MVRVQMRASRRSSVSYLRDLVIRALFASSRLRELQVFLAAEARLETGCPLYHSRRCALAVWPRLFPEFCFHLGGECDVFPHSRFFFHAAPASHATT